MSVCVSVVMPVYNAGPYLSAAIEGILAQTMVDFELLLADDGSTDGSADVCERFSSLDPRVKVVHQRNADISRARNVGIAAATGKWLAFCDHDDLFLPRFLERAVSAAATSRCRVVKVGYSIERRLAVGVAKKIGGSERCSVEDGTYVVMKSLSRSGRRFLCPAE